MLTQQALHIWATVLLIADTHPVVSSFHIWYACKTSFSTSNPRAYFPFENKQHVTQEDGDLP
jgi:hypothetical protein